MENNVHNGCQNAVIQSEKSHGSPLLSQFDTNQLVFYVNGNRIEENRIDPRTTLAVYLRDRCMFYHKIILRNCKMKILSVTTIKQEKRLIKV